MIKAHFDKIVEVGVLLFIFVFATLMLAYFNNEEMARWIENGAIITIIARAFGSRTPTPNTTEIVSAKVVEQPPAETAAPKPETPDKQTP